MTIYERVKSTAQTQGLSLKQLESKAGLGDGAIYKWKKYTPRGANIQKVADVLGVSVDYLLGNTDNKHSDYRDRLFETKMLHFIQTLDEFDSSVKTNLFTDFVDQKENEAINEYNELMQLLTIASYDNLEFSEKLLMEKMANYSSRVTTLASSMLDRLTELLHEKETSNNDDKFVLDSHMVEMLNSLTEEQREKTINKAKSYLEGLIAAYEDD